ncbi:MAG: RidA family protein [Hyphomonas sp.]
MPRTRRLPALLALAAAALTAACVSVEATEYVTPPPASAPAAINRIPIPGSDFPISIGVVIPPQSEIFYVSGVVPSVTDPSADPNSRAAFGDTKAQTVNVLTSIKARMEAAGWSLSDVVMMRVYLVADEDTGDRLDFAGFMAGYSEFFATPEQPNKPARAVMEVAGLINPGWRVEIEVQAARIPAG